MMNRRDVRSGGVSAEKRRPSSSSTKPFNPEKEERARKREEDKNAALQQALQQALTRGSKSKSHQHRDAAATAAAPASEPDPYGRGSATDRLQFGYSPASPEEATLYHAQISSAAWIAARKRNGRVTIVKRQKLRPTNCEPITTMLKLKRYWSRVHSFSDALKEGASGMTVDAADAFLEALSKRQGGDGGMSGADGNDSDDDEATVRPPAVAPAVVTPPASKKQQKQHKQKQVPAAADAADDAATAEDSDKAAKRRRMELL